jgi:catechol 2,3-dioxygenase-like lactoylglutathione lyase family enzyme
MALFDAGITFCYTRDLKRTAHFYEEVLGLPLVLDQGGCRIYSVSDGAYFGFCEREEVWNGKGVILTFVTEDVDAWYDNLSTQGVKFEKEPAFNPDYNIYHCFLRDPNGYLLEIQRFEDPRWPSRTSER